MTSVEQLIETALQGELRQVLVDEAARLLATLSHHPEVADLRIPASPSVELHGYLADVAATIRRQKLVDSCLVGAMIAAAAPIGHPHHYEHDTLRAWMLAAALGLHGRGEQGAAVLVGCRRVRLALRPSEAWLLESLRPLTRETPLTELVERLAAARTAFDAQTPPNVMKERLTAALHVPLRDFLLHRPAIRRNRDADDGPCDEVFAERPVITPPDDGAMRELIVASPDALRPGAPERAFDRPTASRHFDVRPHAPEDHRRHLGVQVMRAKEMARAMSIQALCLPCDDAGLTSHEVTTLLRVAFSPAISGSQADMALCLSLCLGLDIDQLAGMKFVLRPPAESGEAWICKDDSVHLCRRPQLPDHRKGPGAAVLSDHDGVLLLSLPGEIAQSHRVRATVGASELAEWARNRLRTINREHRLRLTPGRLASHLYNDLVQRGEDRAAAGLIAGIPAKARPQLYYHAQPAHALARTHRQWLQHLLTAAGIDDAYGPTMSEAGLIGSTLIPSPALIRRYTVEARRRLGFLRRGGAAEIIRFHNDFILYVWELLTVATGHRPVAEPFPSLKDIDLDGRTIWISDKENRSGGASRVMPLPDVALAQIHCLKRHLNVIADRTALIGQAAVDASTQALAGTAPPLFLVADDGKVETLKPRILKARMRDRWPLPLNWPRHFMRSALARGGVDGELIDAWMGHAAFGQEALGRWSGLSLRDLKTVTDTVADIMEGVGYAAEAAWSSRSK